MAKNKVEYSAQICVSLWLDVRVTAENLEDALAIAKDQKCSDLVKPADSSATVNDEIVTVVGVSRNLPEPF